MKTAHLSDSEFADLSGDTLDPDRAAHVASCATCRAQAAVLHAALHDLAAVDMPEPSPLFWTHFSRRVHDAIATEPAPRRSGWLSNAWDSLGPIGVAAPLVLAVFSGVLVTRAVRLADVDPPRMAGRSGLSPVPGAADRGSETMTDPANAEVWAVLTAAASTLEFQEAHDAGMHVRPAALDAAVGDLSADERAELARLLQSELKRSSN
jgi:hypothetical protein